MDIRAYNREAWNKEAEKGNPWTVPVDHNQILQAKQGNWNIVIRSMTKLAVNWKQVLSSRDFMKTMIHLH